MKRLSYENATVVSALPTPTADLSGVTVQLSSDSKPYWCDGSTWYDMSKQGDVVLAGDLGGTPAVPTVLQVHKFNKTFTYNTVGQLIGLADANGTKTFSYDSGGSLISVTGTGIYQNLTLTYTSGQLAAVSC